ncbi:MAG: hypothetical protein APF84_18170 [Gracilibacter sp. BRH_c7a]|nr:MAG: hypothetical protein APF84_18170 [Gracilibacter sp. BRH_c7a]
MLPSSSIRRKFLAKGTSCITDEHIWKQMVYKVLTKLEKISPVTDQHYLVMRYVREYYLKKNRAPSVKEICTLTGFSMAEFFALFPDWPHTLFNLDCIVCTVLGLPYWNFEI